MIQSEPKCESPLSRFWPVLLIGGVWLWLFWPMMTGQQVVGFRDSAYLYYPLFKWIDAQWAAGEVPLWNPYCNFGMPVVADGTSSVFYPGKLVFFCRFLSYPARYGIFLAIHIPLAASGAYWFARTLRANRAGATLAAFSFAFGGSVLFEVTNVIYLVSAAWLPFALCCVWKMVKTGQIKWAVAAGVCCALMILGGDPQMVYHVGLIAVATIVGEFFRRKGRCLRTNRSDRSGAYRWLLTRSSPRLIVMVITTSLLAAVQLLPTYYWSQLSERTNADMPANIYQALLHPSRLAEQGGVRTLVDEPMGAVDHAYQFSQPPWSLTELLWPNISGKPFPLHQRWAQALPGADRMWVPSLYAGLAVSLLALAGMRFWGRSRKRVWLTWLILFFALASFGWYGVVWLINEISPELLGKWQFGSQVGGLYWLMNMLLPQYFAFRYPAKLFVVASLGLSLLAGVSLRKFRMNPVFILAVLTTLFSVAGLIGVSKFGPTLLAGIPADFMFGPFDLSGATESLNATFMHSIIVGNLIAVTSFLMWRIPGIQFQWAILFLVAVSAIEILVANTWLIPQTKASVFESATRIEERIDELKDQIPGPSPLRIYRSHLENFEPIQWQKSPSSDRLSEIVSWQRETLYPKHHLGNEVVLLGSFSSIWPSSYEQLLNDFERQRGLSMLPQNPGDEPIKRMYHVTAELDKRHSKFMLSEFSPDHYFDLTSPVEWIFEYDPATEFERSIDVPACLWNLPRDSSVSKAGKEQAVVVKEFGINRFVAQVSADRPMMLAFLTAPDRGWKAYVRETESPENLIGETRDPESTNVQLIRSADWNRAIGHSKIRWLRLSYDDLLLLPFDKPGTYEVEFVYSPAEFWIGMWVTITAWISLVVGFALHVWRKNRWKTKHQSGSFSKSGI